ncbi:hypothetical protein EBR43_02755 [bacterium]|nr:hypothetical protein [bacterium]NBX72088.1 hypothetical protein [bacterium]
MNSIEKRLLKKCLSKLKEDLSGFKESNITLPNEYLMHVFVGALTNYQLFNESSGISNIDLDEKINVIKHDPLNYLHHIMASELADVDTLDFNIKKIIHDDDCLAYYLGQIKVQDSKITQKAAQDYLNEAFSLTHDESLRSYKQSLSNTMMLFSKLMSVYSDHPDLAAFFNILPEQINDLTLADWKNKISSFHNIHNLGPDWIHLLDEKIFSNPFFQQYSLIEAQQSKERAFIEQSPGAKIRNDFLREIIRIKKINRKSKGMDFNCNVSSLYEMIEQCKTLELDKRQQFIIYTNNHYNCIDVKKTDEYTYSIIIMDAAADSARDNIAHILKRWLPNSQLLIVGDTPDSIDPTTIKNIQHSNDACGFFSLDHASCASKMPFLHEELFQKTAKTVNGIHYLDWSEVDARFLRRTESYKTLSTLMINKPALRSSPVSSEMSLEQSFEANLEITTENPSKKRHRNMDRFRESLLKYLSKDDTDSLRETASDSSMSDDDSSLLKISPTAKERDPLIFRSISDDMLPDLKKISASKRP